MFRLLGFAFGAVLLVIVSYPFIQDAYSRYQVSQHLDAVMDSREKAEFHRWSGDATSFARALFERCELSQGKSAAACDRYRTAFQ